MTSRPRRDFRECLGQYLHRHPSEAVKKGVRFPSTGNEVAEVGTSKVMERVSRTKILGRSFTNGVLDGLVGKD